MNPAPECSPAHGKPYSPAMGGNLATLYPGASSESCTACPQLKSGHFLFHLKTPLRLDRSGLREIIFRARCWWLIQRIALKMWWRG
jgi:hypothetical protein